MTPMARLHFLRFLGFVVEEEGILLLGVILIRYLSSYTDE